VELNNLGEKRTVGTKRAPDPPAVQTCRLNRRWFHLDEKFRLVSAGRRNQSSGNAKKFDGPRPVQIRTRRRLMQASSALAMWVELPYAVRPRRA
jgi:hypothetical protein